MGEREGARAEAVLGPPSWVGERELRAGGREGAPLEHKRGSSGRVEERELGSKWEIGSSDRGSAGPAFFGAREREAGPGGREGARAEAVLGPPYRVALWVLATVYVCATNHYL